MLSHPFSTRRGWRAPQHHCPSTLMMGSTRPAMTLRCLDSSISLPLTSGTACGQPKPASWKENSWTWEINSWIWTTTTTTTPTETFHHRQSRWRWEKVRSVQQMLGQLLEICYGLAVGQGPREREKEQQCKDIRHDERDWCITVRLSWSHLLQMLFGR